jgi:Calx-beta domain
VPQSNVNAPQWTVNAFTENPPRGGIVQIQVGYYNGGKLLGFVTTPFSYGVSVQVQETFGRCYLVFNRMYGRYNALHMVYHTSDGTAINGVDYTGVSGTITWQDGDISPKTIQIPILQTSSIASSFFNFTVDQIWPSPSQLVFSKALFIGGDINNAANYVQFRTFPITILRQGRGTVSFVGTPYSVTRPGGTTTVTLQVQRFNGFKGAVGVSFHTTDGTALAGVAYTAQTGSLSWADGEGGTKNITITILSGGAGTQSFTVTIDTPTGGVAIGTIPTATVNIVAAAPPANPVAAGSIPQQIYPYIMPSDTTDDALIAPSILWWRKDFMMDDVTMYWRKNITFNGILANKIGNFIGFGPGTDSFGGSPDFVDGTPFFVPLSRFRFQGYIVG